MKPLSALGAAEARGLRGLLFNLDDTVLTHGLLSLPAYRALWSMHDAGILLVAVTGRPSAWGEVIARQWPVDGVITENGAVQIVREGRGITVTGAASPEERARLDAVVADVARDVPEARLTDDVHGRRADVTWDIGERVTLAPASVAAIARIAHAHGARTSRSSVHLHATFDGHDKASGAVRFVGARFGEDAGAALHRWAFAGDSGNDAACFAAFATTFGVANVRAFVSSMSVPPRYVALAEHGAGFAEIAAAILAARA